MKSKKYSNTQLEIYELERAEASQKLSIASTSYSALSQRRAEILSALQSAQRTLNDIYGKNIIHPKYRSFEAVATMYEYLETGKCNTICGHGGIFDTYETERIQIAQLKQLIVINQRLKNIEDNTRYICQQVTHANITLSNMDRQLGNIAEMQKEIRSNTAVAADYSRQAAATQQYIAWKMQR